MLAAPDSLVAFLEPWAAFYGDSSLAQTILTFAHIGGLLVGGGAAVATDRATLRMSNDVDRRRHLVDLRAAHRLVLPGLAVIILSGALLFAADVEAYWGSVVYWLKMGLVVTLLANGARMRAVERGMAGDTAPAAARWSALRGTAMVSLSLWLLVTLAGVALINYTQAFDVR